MMDASFAQADFRGGVWSPYAQGLLEDQQYRHAMNVCFNGYPIEEGAWTRRQGTRFAGYTKGGAYAWLLPFHFSQSAPYVMEFTAGFCRLWNGINVVMTNDPQVVASTNTATPAQVTTAKAHGWSTGDSVQFLLGAGVQAPNAGAVINRRFVITVTSGTTFTIVDEITGNPVDGTTFSFPATGVSVGRLLQLASPYTRAQLPFVNSVTAEVLVNNALQGQSITLHPSVPPQTLALTGSAGGTTFANFTLVASTLIDGPYLDPMPAGATLIASALTGTITLSGAPASTFLSTDVGRMIRLFSEPQLWAVGTAYTTGAQVKYNGLYYTAAANSTGKQPDQNPVQWTINPSAATWTWGVITTVDSDTQVHFTIMGPNLLFSGGGNPIITWRLGLYSGTTGYPTCGVFHEGRLWLGGAQPNRFDASMSNQPYNFTPTSADGTVADNNAISYIFNADDANKILWMTPDHQGIVCGTAGGEFLISASQLSDPLTPTSIQAKRVTKYKASSPLPVRTGLSLQFVQAQQHRLLEYSSDVFSGKFLARNMSEKARHLSGSQIQQIGYQQDLCPLVWSRMGDGSLAAMTYRREKQFTSEPPDFAGWSSHALGSGRIVESMAIGPNVDGTLEAPTFSTNDPTTNIRHIEVLTDMFDETTPLAFSWFLDDAQPPSAVIENAANNTVTLYGYNYLAGKTVTVVAAGLDLGDYTVAANGTIVVPLNATQPQDAANGVGLGLPLFTDAFFNSWVGIPAGPFSTSVNRTVTVTLSSPVSQHISTYTNTTGQVTGTANRDYALQDFARNRFWGLTDGVGIDGWTLYDRTTTAVIRDFTSAEIMATTTNQPNSNSPTEPVAIDDNGYLYFATDIANNTVIRKMNDQGQIVASFGNQASSFLNDNNFISQSGSLATISVWQEPSKVLGATSNPAGFRTYLLSCGGSGPTLNSFTILQTDEITTTNVSIVELPDGEQYTIPQGVSNVMTWAGFTSTVTEDMSYAIRGASFTNGKFSYGDIWLVGLAKPANRPTTTAIGIYRIRISAGAASIQFPQGPTYTGAQSTGITKTRTGGITPAQVDATWTHFSTYYGLAYDKVNNRILMSVQTTDAVTHPQYIIAINPGSDTVAPSVAWATPIAANAMQGEGNFMSQNYIGSGTFSWISASQVANVINTANGSLTTVNLSATQATWGQFSDDRDGQIFYADASHIWHGVINIAGFAAQSSVTTDYAMPAMPIVVGFNYKSQGQILRPVAPDATGARNGPGFAKTRRTHKVGMQVANAQQVYTGCAFDSAHLHPIVFTQADGATALPVDQLFTGVIRTEIDCDYDFDNMIAWQIGRPYPATITAVGGFLATQDI